MEITDMNLSGIQDIKNKDLDKKVVVEQKNNDEDMDEMKKRLAAYINTPFSLYKKTSCV